MKLVGTSGGSSFSLCPDVDAKYSRHDPIVSKCVFMSANSEDMSRLQVTFRR